MTDLILWTLAAFVSSVLTSILWMRRTTSWSDSDYYALVQRYSDAASQLTSMKAEMESLREKLEFSEDVRYSLGIENAKLAEEIEKLKQDIERGEEVRDILVRSIGGYINLHLYTSRRVVQLERSLRIARHKEFKRWKKNMRVKIERDPATFRYHPSPADEFGANEYVRAYCHDGSTKPLLRESIDRLKRMEPYPLP